MFTVLWKLPHGGEELYVAPSVCKMPKRIATSTDEDPSKFDCHGREHIAFQRLDGFGMERMLIDAGDVFVMNAEGNTVATYRFPQESEASLASWTSEIEPQEFRSISTPMVR